MLERRHHEGRIPDAVVIEHPGQADGHPGAAPVADLHDPRIDSARVIEECRRR